MGTFVQGTRCFVLANIIISFLCWVYGLDFISREGFKVKLQFTGRWGHHRGT